MTHPPLPELTESLSRERSVNERVVQPQTRAEEPTPRVGATPLSAGARLGRYLIREPIGAGGMGVVYAAHDPELQRDVAIKLVRPRPGTTRPNILARQERLLREGKAMAQLSHPNVVTVHDLGILDELVFVAMELVEGPTLAVWLRAQPRSWRTVLELYIAAGRGLAAAHAAGLVHRDFKPSNVLIDRQQRPRIADFGLALAHDETSEAELESERTRSEPGRSIQGTPSYMSPEQRSGQEVDARSDQFSFCVALWEGLYGQRPTFDAGAARPASPGRRRAVPTWLRRTLERGLAHAPDERWPSMAALVDRLEHGRSRRRRAVSASAFVAAASLGYAISLASAEPAERPCAGLESLLAPTWDPARGDALVRSLADPEGEGLRTRLAPRIRRGLDDYAAAWTEQYQQACQAHARGQRSDLSYDRQLRCLDNRRVGLEATVELLEAASPELALRGLELVEALPLLTQCADVDTLEQAYPELLDPDEAVQARELDARVTRLRTRYEGHQLAGRRAALERTSATLELLGPDIEALDHPPLLAKYEQLRSDTAYGLGQQEWRAALERSLEAALAAGDDLLVLVNLTEILMGEDDADALYLQLGRSTIRRAKLEHTDAALRFEFAAITETHGSSKQGVRACVALAGRVLAFDPTQTRPRIRLLGLIAHYLRAAGELKLAHEHAQLALERGQAYSEIDAVLMGLDLLGAALMLDRGDYAGAEQLLSQMLPVAEELRTVDVAERARNRAIARERLGDFEGALADLERSRMLSHDALALASISNSLAVILDRIGRYDEARAALGEAMDQARSGPVLDYHLPTLRLTLADIELHAGQLDEARRLFAEGSAWFAEHYGPSNTMVLYANNGLGQVDLAAGRYAEAIPRLERVLEQRLELGARPEELTATKLALGQALWSVPRQRERALDLVCEARAALEASGPGYRVELEQVMDWLAEHQLPAHACG